MSTRYPTATLALAVVAAALSGCALVPEPSPTPTAVFASEEEAFAAAEEVYRSYNEAGNQGRDVTTFLVGRALEGELDTIRYLNQNKLTLDGPSEITSFKGTKVSGDDATQTIHSSLCLDVSATRVLDVDGADVTPSDRAEKMKLEVTFSFVDDELLISDSVTSEDQSC
ncbi:hypothetical protein [Microbacterium sp. NPDC090003]|uniref:hypothetical protein n=1 Tax=Microbacterium sp. NPDC090003 TaxID=3364203 RepID=UPI00380BE8E4